MVDSAHRKKLLTRKTRNDTGGGMSEYDPYKIRINKSKDGEWFDDDQYTHAPEDTLYIRDDMLLERLAEKGWVISLSREDEEGLMRLCNGQENDI